jgi:DNA-binding HxlR family transcriptional regulator
MKEALTGAASSFLQYRIPKEMVPPLTREIRLRIAALSQLVSMLRASVEKDYYRDILMYRPRHEVGTRLAKQLAKLAQCLALLGNPPVIDEEVMRIVTHTAFSSCAAWNMEILKQLVEEDGQTSQELSKSADIPRSTLVDQLSQLVLVGVLFKRAVPCPTIQGAPTIQYWISPLFRKHWENSGLPINPPPDPHPGSRIKPVNLSRPLSPREQARRDRAEAKQMEKEAHGARHDDGSPA